jgi:hypothetical protein
MTWKAALSAGAERIRSSGWKRLVLIQATEIVLK